MVLLRCCPQMERQRYRACVALRIAARRRATSMRATRTLHKP
ncbi:MAG: hypothetical protein AAGG61_06915 [Methanothrix soehngenii]|nr:MULTISPECIES: hypothetical protein [Methanothrix]MDY0411608.1 hypothetical protein [Methanothrix soehngenii]